ncbi:hypothetical protein ACJMK2_011375 [Sinanodonta woodiana]|uniref:C-factor n=1 Tax=Sinanodonta woodiana TaxID=1069815 RepID=A0ABD3V4Y2_SINWO
MFRTGSLLITGANRGIGLETVRQLVAMESGPKIIFACSRNPESAKELELIQRNSGTCQVHILQLDISDNDSINTARDKVESIVKDSGLNTLINNAGVCRNRSFEDLIAAEMMSEYNTMVVGTAMVTKAFLPLLRKAAERSTIKKMAWNKAAILNISSLLGSIALNTGLYISYGACKAALNHLNRSISLHVKNSGIMATVLHPGWVKTDMGGPSAPLEVEESVKDLLKVFLKLDSESTGKFIDFKGEEIPW